MQHLSVLSLLSFISRLLTVLLVLLASAYLSIFDSSPRIVIPTQSLANALTRWDTFHFLHVALEGYVYEYEWAFFPGTPIVMRYAEQIVRLVTSSHLLGRLTIGGALAALICDSTLVLYRLSLHHLGSPSLAFLASVLSLLPASPATLRFTSYSEPFFTCFSYHGEYISFCVRLFTERVRGMLSCAHQNWLLAALFFSVAGTFRSNGILLAGFLWWGIAIQPKLEGRKVSTKTIAYASVLTGIILLPFLQHHYSAYVAFCVDDSTKPSWCSSFPPSIYTHVQSQYWNVGLFRYWTLQQLPNFMISAPPLILLFSFSIWHLRNDFVHRCVSFISELRPNPQHESGGKHCEARSPFLANSITPHAIHAIVLSMTVLLASHTQIILRLAPSMPILYWAAAWLLVSPGRKGWGRIWVGWSVIWGASSLIFWATFLPPA